MTASPLLELTDVSKRYRDPDGNPVVVLDVPSFALAAGEQAVLIGDSGGGKTTLLNIVAGITPASSGSVRVAGTDIVRLAEPARDRFRAENIGIVFQTFQLLPGFSALENVLLGQSFAGGKTDRGHARKLLESVDLADRMDYRPSQLSVGQQQRVAVARALANRPQLLLADEPTANVDWKNQDRVIDLIVETCREQGVAMLMVTHSREVADRFDRVVDLKDVNQAAAAPAAEPVAG